MAVFDLYYYGVTVLAASKFIMWALRGLSELLDKRYHKITKIHKNLAIRSPTYIFHEHQFLNHAALLSIVFV